MYTHAQDDNKYTKVKIHEHEQPRQRQHGALDRDMRCLSATGLLTCGGSLGEAVGLLAVQRLRSAPAGFSPRPRLHQTLLLHQRLLLPPQVLLLD